MDVVPYAVDIEILNGAPVFPGTRVPVRILFEHLEAGDSLDVFLDAFPTVSRQAAVDVLRYVSTHLADDEAVA